MTDILLYSLATLGALTIGVTLGFVVAMFWDAHLQRKECKRNHKVFIQEVKRKMEEQINGTP